jgi:outer membrane protein OmpA-like peptidoglycan-associated protein
MQNYRLLRYLIILIALFGCQSVYSQENKSQDNDESPLYWRSSISGGYLQSKDVPGFERFEGMRDCCEGYGESDGTGTAFGFETGFGYSFFDLNIGISYSSVSNTFYGETEEPVLNSERQETSGVFSHNLETERDFLRPTVNLGINPFWGFRIYGGAGMAIHLGTSYDYIELLEEPQTGVFADTDTRSRNPQEGEIINIDDPMFMYFGAQYELPLSSSIGLYIAPFFEYTVYQASLLTVQQWDHENMRGGVAINYYLPFDLRGDTYQQSIKQKTYIDTLVVQSPTVTPDLNGKVLKGIDRKQTEIDTLQIDKRLYDIVQTVSTYRTDTLYRSVDLDISLKLEPDFFSLPLEFYSEAIPILPYLFFEKNSTLITAKQINDQNWREDINQQQSRHVYINRNLLTILAERINDTGSSITITGYIDPVTEDKCELGKMRAEAVRGLLIERGVPSDKIKIGLAGSSDCGPESRTKTASEKAYAENRRVEISSDNPDLFSSYLAKGLPRIMAVSKDRIKAKYSISTTEKSGSDSMLDLGEAIETVQLFSNIGGRSAVADSQAGTASGIFSIEPMLTGDNRVLINYSDKSEEVFVGDTIARYKVLAKLNNSDTTLEDAKDLLIRYDTSAISKARISLVLFPVGKSDLSSQAKQELRTYSKLLDRNKDLTVVGYADDIGDAKNNEQLAQERAKAVIAYLGVIRPDLKASLAETTAKPVGINSYDTPLERLLSRTVQIEADLRIK